MGSRETPSSCSKALETLNLETPDSSSTDADSPLEEQWLKSSPDLKDEDSVDMVLEDSKEPLTPSSPPTGREIIRYEVNVNQRNIEDICLGCGTLQVYTQHPLFEGGICAPCKDKFLETLFLYDEDGHQSYCTICCSGHTLFICESPDCTRCYCFECVDILVGPGTSERINAMACWVCFLCLPFSRSGLLQRRKKWRHQLKAFHDREGASPMEIYKTVSAWKRQPVRVLSLFGNIDKELKSLGFLESSSGSEGGTLKYVEDVTNVVRRDVERWGPFDLVYGSTQPLGYSCDRCPGWYMFQFHRILQYARPRQDSQQPFFWIFVDNLLLTEDDQETTVRFLQTEAVTLQDARSKVLQNAIRVWSNIPGLKSKHWDLTPKEEQSLQAQVRTRSKLAAQKVDSLVKNCLLPLREYFKYFSQNSLPL